MPAPPEKRLLINSWGAATDLLEEKTHNERIE